jgi:hypothetical protein
MLPDYAIKFYVPRMAGLLEAIQGLQQFTYAFGAILKAFRLSHVHLLFEGPIEVSSFHVHLMYF